MDYSWDWMIFFRSSVTGEGTYGYLLACGLGWTLALSMLSWIIALALATVVGIARTTTMGVPRFLATVFVDIFRNVPLIVQLFVWYFVVPELLPKTFGDALKRMDPVLNQFITVVIGLTLYTAAKASEQIRSGIESISRGQYQASLSMGMTMPQTYCYVILPQAFRAVIPPLTSDFLNVFKNSSIALTIGLMELTGQTYKLSEFSAQPFEFFALATLIYMTITYLVIRLMQSIEARIRIPGTMGASHGI